MPDTAEQKQQLRKQCRQVRQEIGEQARWQASQSICARIENWPVFQRSEVILAYMPIRGEVDLTPLLERHPQKRWLLPRIIPAEDHRMVFHPYDANHLVHHPFGMAEPAADLPVFPPAMAQLALVPGLAYDRQGWRLGYGGGYYDRFLKNFTGTSLGAIFAALLLENLPHSEFDAPVAWLATEGELFKAAG